MAFTVNTLERFGSVHRAPRINPYLPARTERLGATSDNPKFSLKDIGKPVKLSGDTCVLATDGDEIYGFIESVNAGTNDGYAIGGVICDPGLEALAVDEVGNLAVGDLVVAGTPVAIGTAIAAKGANVKKRTGAVASGQSALLTSGGLAIGSASKAKVLVANTVYALVGGALVSATTAEVTLPGVIADAKSNAYGIFINAAGEFSAVLGTAGDTVAEIVLPQANATRALVGYVVITNDGAIFTGGTTLLDANTVTDVYINTLGAVAQADQIAGQHLWQVLSVFGTPAAGVQVMVRKI
ncbi:MAG: hypothetical protein EOM21_17855 [Gammaproteobacteria bacterium]|nr:hypothetical protein [Gammaproteobacteria bacterium]